MTTKSPPTTSTNIAPIVEAQLTSLSDTDCYASSWEEALKRAASNNETFVKWGGRGQGGRGLARRTFQPHDVIVEDVRLEYVSQGGSSLSSKLLLDGATLKLLSGHVYGLVGRNGTGKSSLLRRIHARQIPGFPTHLTSVYIPQEGIPYDQDNTTTATIATTTSTISKRTPLEMVIGYYHTFRQESHLVMQRRADELEQELRHLDMSSVDDAQRVEDICQEQASLEENMKQDDEDDDANHAVHDSSSNHHHELVKEATDALHFFGIDPESRDILSGGQRVKVALACALFCRCNLLLLDEPNYLDIYGLLQLRRLIDICQERKTTVLLTSHDVDLMNDVVTDIIQLSQQTLSYYAGNYQDFIYYKEQREQSQVRQQHVNEKKKEALQATLDNMKKQAVPKRGGNTKKNAKAIGSFKKRMERQEQEMEGIKPDGPTIGYDAPIAKGGKRGRNPVVDKAVQFVFRNTTSTWGEPLITAMDISHGFGPSPLAVSTEPDHVATMLLDCVDLCVDEGKRIVILGSSACGKSTLLKLLAKTEQPLQGKVQHAHNVTVGLLDQHAAEQLMEFAKRDARMTALSCLAQQFPLKNEQELRVELKHFGLGPKQVSTSVQFLSGGERSRLCFASLMLQDPHVLLLDTPTSHLDVESVEALVQGLNQWNGTLVMATHDAYLIRSIENAECYVIHEEKLFRLRDGFDRYLRTFRL